jgi:hypothetical protein
MIWLVPAAHGSSSLMSADRSMCVPCGFRQEVTGATPVPNAASNRSGAKASSKRTRGRANEGLPLARVQSTQCPRGARQRVVSCRVPAAIQDGALRCADISCASPLQRQTDAGCNTRTCPRNFFGEANPAPWIAQAQADSAYGGGTKDLLRSQR